MTSWWMCPTSCKRMMASASMLAKLAAMAGDDHTDVRLDDTAAVNAGPGVRHACFQETAISSFTLRFNSVARRLSAPRQ